MTTPQSTPTQDFAQEEWRPCPGAESVFEVSNLGRVRRLVACRGGYAAGRISGVLTSDKRYPRVRLRRADGHPLNVKVHLLIAVAFLGPTPEGYEINHVDGKKNNNRLDNLEFVTHEGNMRHASEAGLLRVGTARRNTKLTDERVREMRMLYADGVGPAELAQRFGVCEHTVRCAVKRATWRHVA